jgi:hypothetical protein
MRYRSNERTTIEKPAHEEMMDVMGTHTTGTKHNKRLWAAQGVLAAIFLFAGASKLLMPAETLTDQSPFPALFLRFIGCCEVLGALGLILPGLLRIQLVLTPLAAAGLVVIMVGAVVSTLAIGQGAAALFPLVVGLLAAYVARGRGRQVLQGAPARATRLHPAGELS